MSEGFVIDHGDANRVGQQNWVEGQPERSLWLGIKTKGREKYTITTWRCDKCGYLESYAQDRA
jgi:hypothetical protein